MPVTITPKPEQQESEFGKLFESQEGKTSTQEGNLIRGRVVEITKSFVVMDVGLKSEGQIPIEEFINSGSKLTVKPGDEIEVLLESIEDEHGRILLSKSRAESYKAWDQLAKIEAEGGIVEGQVIGKTKGGLVVNLGVEAFLPISQIDVRPVHRLDKFLGKKVRVKIVKMNQKRGNLVVSRKAVMEKEKEGGKEELVKQFKEGQVVHGTVKNITDYGVFVDLGGIDGLMHVTDMSWSRVGHPSDLVEAGDELEVKVLKVDEAQGRVALGVKQLKPDPWSQVESKFIVGSKVSGKVTHIVDYGVFLELEPGLEGLIHISELTWSKKIKHANQVVSVGMELEAVVLDCDAGARRISLGVKQLKSNPWDELEKRNPIGSKVTGVIRNITDFGLFVDTGQEIDGLVHISDIDWIQNFLHPAEVYKKGETVEAVVLHIDRDQEKFALGLKQLKPNPWEKIQSRFEKGARLTGKVVRTVDSGVWIELEEGVCGWIPKTKLATGLSVGQSAEVEVITLDPDARKFHLNLCEKESGS